MSDPRTITSYRAMPVVAEGSAMSEAPDLLLDRAIELFAACPDAPGLCLWCRVVAELLRESGEVPS
jgi:hypothetical protein